MLVQVLAPDDPSWTKALLRTTHDFYHTPDYVSLEARRLKAVPEALVVSDGERQLFLPYLVRSCEGLFPGVGGGIRDVVSPYGYPGILLNDAARDSQFATSAWDAVQTHWRNSGVCSAFLRMHPILGHGYQSLLPAGVLLDTGETVAVDLRLDEAEIRNQLAKNHRRTLEKCRKFQLTSRVVSLASVIDPFMEIYGQTMDRLQAHESYYFDRDYFAALAAMPNVHCSIVESGTAIVSVCILFETGGIVQYHLGGTAADFFSQSPFHLCLFDALHWAKERGNRWAHLGGGVGGARDQLFNFKASFSPIRFSFHTARIVLDDSRYRQLVEAAATALSSSPAELLNTNYFPAYRAMRVE